MSDFLPPDLPRLRVLETWAEIMLGEIRRRIAEAEQWEAAMRPVRPLPEGPTWVLSYLREGGQPVADSVHVGGCSMASRHTRSLDREQAREALASHGIRACEICRPDSELGILD
ncbi:DUF6233 domain-containing protein [Streptomyces sp. NPDC056169]|uniref:DUF6233 domain-containing protein n=1 Tax=Streptomyces sp. NPDC056169 TaxID=3345734 RepID=UPI0035E1A63C